MHLFNRTRVMKVENHSRFIPNWPLQMHRMNTTKSLINFLFDCTGLMGGVSDADATHNFYPIILHAFAPGVSYAGTTP